MGRIFGSLLEGRSLPPRPGGEACQAAGLAGNGPADVLDPRNYWRGLAEGLVDRDRYRRKTRGVTAKRPQERGRRPASARRALA